MIFTDDRNGVKSSGRGDDTIGQLRNGRGVDLLHCHCNRPVESHVNQHRVRLVCRPQESPKRAGMDTPPFA